MQYLTLHKNEYVYQQGDPVKFIYFLLKGSCMIINLKERESHKQIL